MWQVVVSRPEKRDVPARRLWDEAVKSAGLGRWLTPVWQNGSWALWFEGRCIWRGRSPSSAVWTDALLDAWWDEGGGCC
jgi:hypothetical protein